jgi:hypothetical protein
VANLVVCDIPLVWFPRDDRFCGSKHVGTFSVVL